MKASDHPDFIASASESVALRGKLESLAATVNANGGRIRPVTVHGASGKVRLTINPDGTGRMTVQGFNR